MLSVFPHLLSYQQIAPLLIRLILAAIFLGSGYSKIFKTFNETSKFFASKKLRPGKFWAAAIGILEMAAGIMLLLGLLTQIGAIIISLIMLAAIILVKRKEGFLGGYDLELLILACALSLLILGPGILSLDLPL